jgi:hypothetical protein
MIEVWEKLQNEYQDKLMLNRWSLSIILNKTIIKMIAKSFKVANMLHVLEGGVNFGVMRKQRERQTIFARSGETNISQGSPKQPKTKLKECTSIIRHESSFRSHLFNKLKPS